MNGAEALGVGTTQVPAEFFAQPVHEGPEPLAAEAAGASGGVVGAASGAASAVGGGAASAVGADVAAMPELSIGAPAGGTSTERVGSLAHDDASDTSARHPNATSRRPRREEERLVI